MTTKKDVTEVDFRMPEFRDADPADYEFREDGKIVRKDRWENAVRTIAGIVGYNARTGFEIEDVIDRVKLLARAAAPAPGDRF